MTTETAVSPTPQNSPATSDAPASGGSQTQNGGRSGGASALQNARRPAPLLRRRGRGPWGNGDNPPGSLEVGQFVALVRRVERLQRQMEYYVSARYTKERIRYARRFQAVIGQLSERIADELDAVTRDVNRLRKGRAPTGPLADEVAAPADGDGEAAEV